MPQENATHEATGVTASAAMWQAARGEVCRSGERLLVSRLPDGFEELLFLGIDETGDHGPRALAAAMRERNRRQEAKTAATADARLADAIASVARIAHEDTAEALIARLPARLRPYVEQVRRS